MTTFAQAPGGGGDINRDATVNLNANITGYSQGMSAAQAQTNQLGGAVEELTRKVDGLAKRAGRTLIHVGVAGGASLGAAAADAAALQKQLGTLAATAAVTGTGMAGLKADVNGAFEKFPLARGQVVALVQDISSLGVTSARDIGSLTNTIIKLGAATGESIPELAQGLIQLSRLMGNTGASEIGNYANSLLTVSKNAGVSATGVLAFAQAIAPLARQAGIGEAAVLGISTAFSKAGADGYVAANTLNSIVADITTLERTGSPALAKYSSLVGQTVGQFKGAGVQRNVLDLFKAFGSSSPQVQNFIDQNYGIRAQSALAAVSQSGNMASYIAQATGAASNQNNLNAGSKAALNNLDDTLARIRNELTQFGEIIGGPLLSPLNALGKAFAGFLGLVNSLVKAMGPLPALLGSVASVLAVITGGALTHAATIGTLATARLLLSPNSGLNRARREGREVGAAQAGGLSEQEALGLNATGQAKAAGTLPRRLEPFFWLGRQRGGAGPSMGSRLAGTGFFGSMFAGFGQGHSAATGTPEGEAPPGRPGLGTTAAGYGVRGLFGLPSYLLNQQAKGLRDSRLPDYERSAYKGMGGAGSAAEQAAVKASVALRLAESGIIKLTAKEMAALARAAASAAVETARAGASMAGAAASAGLGGVAGAALGQGRMAGMAMGAGRLAGAGAGLLGRGLGALGGLAMGPWGLAAMAALPVAQGLWGAFRSRRDASNQSDVTASLNPIKQYNDALGIATTNLASFSNGLATATMNAGTQSTATTFTGAATVTPTDFAQYSRSKSSDPTISALAKHSKNDVAAISALVASYGISDPRQLDMVKQNLLAAGNNQASVSAALGSFTPGGPVDYRALGGAINATEGHGFFASNASRSGNKLIASDLSSIGTQYQQNLSTHSVGYASAQQFNQALQLLSGQAVGAKNPESVKALANTLATLTGGSQNSFMDIMASSHGRRGGRPNPQAFNQGAFAKMDSTDQNKYLISVLQRSDHGRQFLAGIPPEVVNDPTRLGSYLAANQNVLSDQQQRIGSQFGALGTFATSNTAVLSAAGSQAGNPAAVQGAVAQLAGTAAAGGASYARASADLMKLSDAMGGADTATGALIASAAQWVRTLQSFSMPTLSRNTQLGTLLGNVQQSKDAAEQPGASQATVDQYKSDLGAYEQQKEGYRQYLLGIYQQAQQFGVSMKRAAEDQNTSIYRAQRGFYIQMGQAQADFQRQSSRSQQDFAISEARQAQAEAQSIYNPFMRVQAVYTEDAGTLLNNLADQNRRISQQSAQLAQARKMGLSQQAIDTLDLSNPNNAQQLNTLVQSLANDPALIAQINKQSASRLAATTKLTQSQFNLNFRNTVADFTRALGRASQDYQTAHDRAVAAQSIALGDMSADYTKMINRSAADLKTAMTEITGSFGQVFGASMDMVNKQVAHYAPGAAALIDKELSALKTKYPVLFQDSGLTTLDPGGPVKPGYRGKQIGGFAHGGIATKATYSTLPFGEAGPEALIPLNQRGQDFMAGLITRALAQGVTAAYSAHPLAMGSHSEDHSNNFSGPVTVQAADPGELARALEAKAKLAKLARMGRSGART